MTNNKWNPVNPSQSLGKLIDNLFTTTLADVIGSDYAVSHPSVNITDHENHFLMELAAPGLEKKDFNLQIEKDHLVVSAEKKVENEESEKGKFTRREFNYSAFKRSFFLDENINREGITAAYENGVLRITLPKKEESWKKPSVSTIEIK
jgi:HSP20 family protein